MQRGTGVARRGKLKFEWVPKSWTGGWHGVQISLVPSHPDFKINLKKSSLWGGLWTPIMLKVLRMLSLIVTYLMTILTPDFKGEDL